MRNAFKYDFTINTLGVCKITTPIKLSTIDNDYIANYRSDIDGILSGIEITKNTKNVNIEPRNIIERAGPRKKIYFDPSKTRAAIVTCGGLCPGLNSVIRSLVMALWYRYGVRNIFGVQFGYRGFLPEFNLPFIELNPDSISDIHQKGGTILGSSRGYGNRVEDIVDTLERNGINILFTIGGDGTQKGAINIYKELKKRNLKISVVGVPKTIDNDLSFVQKSFGFDTAVTKAVDALYGAHIEAKNSINGIGLVKVMGRESGYIAAHTALASTDANFVLIPEVPFDLYGSNGLLKHIKKRLIDRKHALIVVAEGAGEELLETTEEVDASGNKKRGDIGTFLCAKIKEFFADEKMEINLKYIDPSYIIRSAPANPNDSIYCERLGTNAVHAAMAGKTGMLISQLHDHMVHIPIKVAVNKRNRINPDHSLWRDVLEATGQPPLMKN